MSDRVWFKCPDCGDLARYSPTLCGVTVVCVCGGLKEEVPNSRGVEPHVMRARVYRGRTSG